MPRLEREGTMHWVSACRAMGSLLEFPTGSDSLVLVGILHKRTAVIDSVTWRGFDEFRQSAMVIPTGTLVLKGTRNVEASMRCSYYAFEGSISVTRIEVLVTLSRDGTNHPLAIYPVHFDQHTAGENIPDQSLDVASPHLKTRARFYEGGEVVEHDFDGKALVREGRIPGTVVVEPAVLEEARVAHGAERRVR